MRPIEHEASLLRFAGELPSVPWKERQVRVQGPNRNRRKREQADPEVRQRRQQFVSLSRPVCYGSGEIIDASHAARHNRLQHSTACTVPTWATGVLLRARPVIGHLSSQMVGDVDDLDHIWHGPAHHPLEPLSQGQLRGGTALTPSGHLNVEVSVRDFHKHNLAAVRVDSGIDFPVQEILDECSDLGVSTLAGVDALWAREDSGYATSQLLTDHRGDFWLDLRP